MEIKKRASFCADCGDHCCLTACTAGAINMTADKGAVIDPAKCTLCMACCQACCMMNDPVFGVQVANYKEKEKDDMTTEEVKNLIAAALKDQAAAFAEQFKTINDSLKTLTGQFSELSTAQGNERLAGQRREFTEFLSSPEMAKRIPEASRAATIAHLITLTSAAPVEFGEGDTKTTLPAVDAYKAQLRALPPVVEFSEFATKDKGAIPAQKNATRKEFDSWAPDKQREFSCSGGALID